MGHIDAAGGAGIKNRAADGRRVEGVLADLFRIDQIVRANCGPTDQRVLLTDVGAQIVGGLLIVGLGWQQPTQQTNHHFLPRRNRLVQVPVAVACCVHQHEFDRRLRLVALDGLTEPAGGVGDQSAGRAEDAFQRQVVAQAGSHRVTTRYVLGQLCVAEFQQAGLNDGQVRVILYSVGQPVGGAYDDANVLAAGE